MRLFSLLRAIQRRIGGVFEPRRPPAPPGPSPKERQDTLKLIARARRQISALERQFERGLLIRQEEAAAPGRLDQLDDVLSVHSVAYHVRRAVARGSRVDHPVAHSVIEDLLPDVVFDALREAIPARVFFDDGGNGCAQLPVPPALAPAVSMATWAFAADLASDVLVPVLVDGFRHALDERLRQLAPDLAPSDRDAIRFTVSHARLVRWEPGCDRDAGARPQQMLGMVLSLGEREHHVRLHGTSGDVMDVAVRPNSAVAFLGVASQGTAAPATEGSDYTYEISIGPGRASARLFATAQ